MSPTNNQEVKRDQPWQKDWPPQSEGTNHAASQPVDDSTTGAMPATFLTARGVDLWRLDDKEALQSMLAKQEVTCASVEKEVKKE
ncbi:uncharacterized protein MYCFIDRAFT_203733 [Pseudocercospora fijiensis CIRAD86]|uniref:Uncharacterized protein n=1 Tax=Pseudocercospora fijiensis (strain CIRAD86) TaxID=383855 RepID=M3AVS9_PSEFD|nr:uncharacterized protein MYCFIDRAFT_203733 [Pseudocercospora fijiensis CIRAD86]EME81577.1 hypothetical protein MYCFIDRAFT_203733 [Pseudocercospora fijiensis CIRAD86]